MLARVPNTRSTKDIDLAINGYSLDQALSRLRSLAAVDLQDQFPISRISSAPNQ